MAYALALESFLIFSKGNGDVMLLLSMILIQGTVILVATLLYPIVRCLDLKSTGHEDVRINPIENSGPITKLKQKLADFHANVLKPIFSDGLLIRGMKH